MAALSCLSTDQCLVPAELPCLGKGLNCLSGKFISLLLPPRPCWRSRYGGSSFPTCLPHLSAQSLSSYTQLQRSALITRSFIPLTVYHNLILLSLQLASSHCKILSSCMLHSSLLIKRVFRWLFWAAVAHLFFQSLLFSFRFDLCRKYLLLMPKLLWQMTFN